MFGVNPTGQLQRNSQRKAAGADGRELELQTTKTHIQWRYKGFSKWADLVAVKDLQGIDGKDGKPGAPGIPGEKGDVGITGQPGIDGKNGLIGPTGPSGPAGPRGLEGEKGVNGIDGKNGAKGQPGREIQLQTSKTHIQWRYKGELLWHNLILLAELKGPRGDQGQAGPQGERGLRGVQGYTGAAGTKGETGAAGPQGPPGPGGGDEWVTNEVPSGAVDGINNVFSTAFAFVSGETAVSINGLRQTLNLHYTESGISQVTISDAPFTGDIITIDYIKA